MKSNNLRDRLGNSRAAVIPALMGALLFAAACDNDPAAPSINLSLVGCPTTTQLINSPISLGFNEALLPSSVTSANVIVTDAATGVEIPGAVQVAAGNSSQVVFVPSAPFAFDKAIRVRVQNLLPAAGGTAAPVTVCDLRTELPPIREIFWRALPSASGTTLPGVSLVDSSLAYVLSVTNTLFRYEGSAPPVAISFPPYYIAANDVSFVSRLHGFVSVTNQRNRQTYVIETLDGGATWDSVGSVSISGINRVYYRAVPSQALPFGVVGGGQTLSPSVFLKYNPNIRGFDSTSVFSGSGVVNDIDFPADTTKGASVSGGIRIGSRVTLGALFVTANGGRSWTEVPEARAPDSVLTYRGVAVKSNGEIFVVGGNGYVARVTPNGSGPYTVTQKLLPATNPDVTNPNAFILNDIEFVRGNDNIGWIVGAIQTGVVNGVPRFEGIIFITRDGGTTWIRQGVTDAPNYGAEFPPLNRLDVLSATQAWAVGAAGAVIRYAGSLAQ